MPHEFERRGAHFARLSVAPIDKVVELKVARLTGRIDEIPER
jgi:hypothetical protein